MKIKNIVYIGMLTAFLCIISPFSVSLGLVPVSLSGLMVIFVSLLAGWKGTASVLLYIILGSFGLPVFSNFTGGIQQLLGITGGYIIGYIPASITIVLITQSCKHKYFYYISAIIGNVIILIFGTIWYMFIAKVPLWTAVGICVLPFIFTDIIKMAISAYFSLKVKNRLEKYF